MPYQFAHFSTIIIKTIKEPFQIHAFISATNDLSLYLMVSFPSNTTVSLSLSLHLYQRLNKLLCQLHSNNIIMVILSSDGTIESIRFRSTNEIESVVCGFGMC